MSNSKVALMLSKPAYRQIPRVIMVQKIYFDLLFNLDSSSFCGRGILHVYLGEAHKLIGNALQISARVCKVKLAMNLVHICKINCLCLLSKCLFAVFMVFRASIRQYILDLLPNQLYRLFQISAKHCRLVSVPPLNLIHLS